MREIVTYRKTPKKPDSAFPSPSPGLAVSLLTGGGDRPYVFGLGTALISRVVQLDVIGSDELDSPEFHGKPGVHFINLRGSQQRDVSVVRKISRVTTYYLKLIRYAYKAKPVIFHILWNNKFESFDRTLLLLYYKWLKKKIVFTAHNVNAGLRDSKDTFLNRLTLKAQYRLVDHVLVHTEPMRQELIKQFRVQSSRITVIPFGINNAVPNTSLTPAGAKRRLGVRDTERTILFFGNIRPYKGLEYLVAAFQEIRACRDDYRLIIAGKPTNCEKYWGALLNTLRDHLDSGRVLLKAEFIPDEETEVYFKAADLLVLPYTHVYQSGVLFLAKSFGLPVLAADVGSLKDDIVEGKNGFVFKSKDPVELARAIDRYFASDLYANLTARRQTITDHAMQGHSWNIVSRAVLGVYADMLRMSLPETDPVSVSDEAFSRSETPLQSARYNA